jgi:RHS repeat-associated protein
MLNGVEEQNSSGSVTADMLAGGLDDWMTRTDSSGTNTMLVDGRNSTVGLVNSSGTLATQFTYEPFGRTTFNGSGTSNLYRFAGREIDLTGLYFMRARYYNPVLQRFISPDPSGFGGGAPNLYVYVGNSPTNSIDPLGLGGSGWNCGEDCSTLGIIKQGHDPFLSSAPGGIGSQSAGGGMTVEQVADVLLPDSIGGFAVTPGIAPSGVLSGIAGVVPRRIPLAQGAHQAPAFGGIIPVQEFRAPQPPRLRAAPKSNQPTGFGACMAQKLLTPLGIVFPVVCPPTAFACVNVEVPAQSVLSCRIAIAACTITAAEVVGCLGAGSK